MQHSYIERKISERFNYMGDSERTLLASNERQCAQSLPSNLVISKISLKQALHRSPRSLINCFSSNLKSTRSFWLPYQTRTIRSMATQPEHRTFSVTLVVAGSGMKS